MSLRYQKDHLAHKKLLCDDIVFPELENVPPKFCISHRNKWMISHSDIVIAYVSHSYGGAYQSYKYALSKGKTMFNLSDKAII